MMFIALVKSFFAKSDNPIVFGFCCSVSKHPNLNLCENDKKSSAVYSSFILVLIVHKKDSIKL